MVMKLSRLVVLCTTIGISLSIAPRVLAQDDHMNHAAVTADTPSAAPLVKAVQGVTRQFLDIEDLPSDYGPFLGCVSSNEEGAMGIHYVNGGFVDDGQIQVNEPEALIYEQPKWGKPRLVGVEYIVKVEDWYKDPMHKAPPVLMGQVFNLVTYPNRYGLPAFYELHVWAWRGNPKGTFADFNTRVTCDFFNPPVK
jgi:hypothetical protein